MSNHNISQEHLKATTCAIPSRCDWALLAHRIGNQWISSCSKLVGFAMSGIFFGGEGAQSSAIELQVKKHSVSWWFLVQAQLFKAELSFHCGLGSVQ